MFNEKAGNDWKRKQLRSKASLREMSQRQSKRSIQSKKKKSSRDISKRSHIKLDLKGKIKTKRGNTSRNMSIKKRGTYNMTSRNKGYSKKHSVEKGKRTRRVDKGVNKQGLMGMLKEKVKRNQKSLSRMAMNYNSRIQGETRMKSRSKLRAQKSREIKKKQVVLSLIHI